MTTRGKIVLTIIILGVVGFGMYRWWDKIAPQSKPQTVSVDVAKVRKEIADLKNVPPDIPLLAGTNVATLVERSGIPAVSGVSDYKKETKDGKPVVEFPINVWPGWAPIIMANAGMEPNDQSVFAKKYGFYVHLAIVDDPVKARDLFASGQSHILWGTLDMIALFAPELVKDSRTVPVVCQQVDFSAGGDGVVARGEIRSINDFRIKDGKRRTVERRVFPGYILVNMILTEESWYVVRNTPGVTGFVGSQGKPVPLSRDGKVAAAGGFNYVAVKDMGDGTWSTIYSGSEGGQWFGYGIGLSGDGSLMFNIQELETILATVEVASPTREEIHALIAEAPSLRYVGDMNEGALRNQESQWHRIYIGWHSILGQLKVRQRGEKAKSGIGAVFGKKK